MRNINESLEQIIENLLLIKNNTTNLSQIDKDILLQNLREAYLVVLQSPAVSLIQSVDNQEEIKEESQIAPENKETEEKVKEEPVGEVQDSEIPAENLEIEEEIPVLEEKEIMVEEEPIQNVEEEEMDTDILEFIKDVPQTTAEVKPAHKEPELFAEPEPIQEPIVAPEPEPVVVPEPEPVSEPEPIVEQEAEKLEDSELTEKDFELEPIPEPVVAPEPEPVPEPKKVVVPEPVVEAKPEPVAVPEPAPAPKVSQLQMEVKPQQRSLNDLFNEQKQDLGDKFQQTKVSDLTKAMSINDKFLFIRELFKNKSEEFSRAIQTLNQCENIEDAFDIMEGLKKQYFWDSTSSAYLALCDLVRRKF